MKNTFSKLSRLLTLYFSRQFVLDELIFFITYKCNFRCKTCFYAGVMDNDTVSAEKELTIDEIRTISSSLGKFHNLLISGGEPFLRSDLSDICEVFYHQNKISNIHLPTNGFFTKKIYENTRKILRQCPKINLTIGLPLDGLQETHDKIKGIKGSFEKVTETAKKLSALKKEFGNLTIYIITTVNKTNLNEIIMVSEFVKNNLPVDNHGPSPMRGSPNDKTLLPPSYEEWIELSGKLAGYQKYWNVKNSDGKLKAFLTTNKVRYLDKMFARVLKGRKLPFRCQAGNIIGVMEPNGDVKLCELTEAIGNVRSVNYDFRRVWFSDKANEVRKKIKNCTCAHACFLTPSIKMNPISLVKSYFPG